MKKRNIILILLLLISFIIINCDGDDEDSKEVNILKRAPEFILATSTGYDYSLKHLLGFYNKSKVGVVVFLPGPFDPNIFPTNNLKLISAEYNADKKPVEFVFISEMEIKDVAIGEIFSPKIRESIKITENKQLSGRNDKDPKKGKDKEINNKDNDKKEDASELFTKESMEGSTPAEDQSGEKTTKNDKDKKGNKDSKEVVTVEKELIQKSHNELKDMDINSFINMRRVKNNFFWQVIWDKNHDFYKTMFNVKSYEETKLPAVAIIDRAYNIVKTYSTLDKISMASMLKEVDSLSNQESTYKSLNTDEVRIAFSGMNRGVIQRDECSICKGGLSLTANAIKEYRSANKEVPVINTGNFMQNYYNEYSEQKKYILSALKVCNFDFYGIGLLELLSGSDYLMNISNELTVLASNIKYQKNQDKINKYLIKKIGSKSVGFISIVDPKDYEMLKRFSFRQNDANSKEKENIKNIITDIEFINVDDALSEAISDLKSKDVDIIAVITHYKQNIRKPYEMEKKLIESYPNVKLVIDASESYNPSLENFVQVGNSVIIQMDKKAESLTDFIGKWDTDGNLKYFSVNYIPITQIYGKNEEITKINLQFNDEVMKSVKPITN